MGSSLELEFDIVKAIIQALWMWNIINRHADTLPDVTHHDES